MRALAYHELLLHFAKPYSDKAGENPGVPYRDFYINSPAKIDQAVTQGRNSVAEVYTRILEDLAFAEENLPETRSDVQKVTRATQRGCYCPGTTCEITSGKLGSNSSRRCQVNFKLQFLLPAQ